MNCRSSHKFLLVIFLIGIVANSCFAQIDSFSITTMKIIKRIEKLDYLMIDYKISNKSIKLAKQLDKAATSEELTLIANNNDGILLCISFWILAKRQEPVIEEIYKNHALPSNGSFKTTNINKLKRNKSDVILLMNEYSFIEDIYLKKKYIDLIK